VCKTRRRNAIFAPAPDRGRVTGARGTSAARSSSSVAEQVERGYASQQPEFVLRRPEVIVSE
jgi:hypothetical protein